MKRSNCNITWLKIVIDGLTGIGGYGHLSEIQKQCKIIALKKGKNIPVEFNALIRDTLESNSKDSKKFKGKDIFSSVEGLGKGVWRLNE